jgi:hypothetical protein
LATFLTGAKKMDLAERKKPGCRKRKVLRFGTVSQNIFTFAHQNEYLNMKKNEEYVPNTGRDWLIFGAGMVLTIALLFFKPEWVWAAFPFVFTGLAGALGRL